MKSFLALLLLFSTFSTANHASPDVDKKLVAEVHCMALNMFFEARGEGKAGMIAVGHVTLNRVKSPKFPNSICSVVKQPGQFSWYKSSMNFKSIAVPDHIQEIAFNMVTGQRKYIDHTKGALYFHHEDVQPFRVKYRTKIGKHLFYT